MLGGGVCCGVLVAVVVFGGGDCSGDLTAHWVEALRICVSCSSAISLQRLKDSCNTEQEAPSLHCSLEQKFLAITQT